ncbi:septum formation family protein [Naasia lichenicola]|uniref:septum formation family protein n=1 Tax=Naasia lichenicola TaxID=2565933 RepID=UPI00130EE5B5|nr:septum formation family protein [Naasia lichenicola]
MAGSGGRSDGPTGDPQGDDDVDPFAPLTPSEGSIPAAAYDAQRVRPQGGKSGALGSDALGPDALTEPLRVVRTGARRRAIIGTAIGAAALAGLVAAFAIGSTLRGEPAADPQPTLAATTAAPTPTPAPLVSAPVAEAVVGPATPGLHPWDELGGGECLAPYTSPWDLEYTVVDCAAAHTAQLTYRGALPDAVDMAYPGEAAIVSQLGILCSAPTALDLGAAAQYPDLQTQASYPAGQAQWDSGDREYSCFTSRTSGEPLIGSLAPAA